MITFAVTVNATEYPQPLRYQFKATHKDQFTWNYLEQGPEIYRMKIGKV